MDTKAEPVTVSRRRFITHVMGGIGAAIAAILGLPLSRYVAYPATNEPQVNWAGVGPIDDFKAGEMRQVVIDPTYDAPLAIDKGKRAAYVVKKVDGTFDCFYMHCTHAGCPVRWSSGPQRFFSPCHGGVFDKEGRVLAGPPPRPLDRYEYKVEAGILYLGEVYQVDERLERVG